MRMVVVKIRAVQPYRFTFLNPPAPSAAVDPLFQRTAFSLRELTRRDVIGFRPSTIRIVAVQPDDGMVSLAARQPMGPLNEPWFNTLNHNALMDGLRTGEAVKLISR